MSRRTSLLLVVFGLLIIVVIQPPHMQCSSSTPVEQPTPEPTPAATPTPEPPPNWTTIDVRRGDCLGILDYSKVAGEMKGTLTANQENLGYRLEGKTGYNSLSTQPTEFKILPPSGNGDYFPRYIAFVQKVDGIWQEIERIDLPPWMSVDNCGYNVKFTVIGDDGVRITGDVMVYVWSTE